MTQNEHGYAKCCRPEVDGDVISGRNVKTANVSLNQIKQSSERAMSIIVAARRSDSFWSGICHRIRVGRAEMIKEIDHICKWGANRNRLAGYRMSSSGSGRAPNRVVVNRRPQIEHIMGDRRAA